MNWLALALLIVCLSGLWLIVRRGRREYGRFKTLTETADRQRYFRKWVVTSFAQFTGASVVGLALLGRLNGFERPAPEFRQALNSQLLALIPVDPLASDGFLLGMGIGVGVLAVLAVLATRRRRARPRSVIVVGEILPLMPRNWPETGHTAAMSLNAGFSEELFFRALLPLLFVLVTGQPVVSLLLAGLIFGLAHAYQGWIGIVATTVVGLVFTFVFLATGSLWVAIGLHAAMDLMALVVRPSLRRLFPARTATP